MTLYHESHVTVEPPTSESVRAIESAAKRWGFKLADLAMLKDRAETPERSRRDSFLSSRGDGSDLGQRDLHARMLGLAMDLGAAHVKVWRCKIEAVVFDQRYGGEDAA